MATEAVKSLWSSVSGRLGRTSEPQSGPEDTDAEEEEEYEEEEQTSQSAVTSLAGSWDHLRRKPAWGLKKPEAGHARAFQRQRGEKERDRERLKKVEQAIRQAVATNQIGIDQHFQYMT